MNFFNKSTKHCSPLGRTASRCPTGRVPLR